MNRLAITTALLTLTLAAGTSQAQSIRLKCETRADRSTASVDGTNLIPGAYTAILTSGANSALADARSTVGDEVGFDFSSQARDIRRGATRINPSFIIGGQASAQLMDANGAVVASATQRCRVR